MVFRDIALGMTALVVSAQLVVAAATVSILTFHPGLIGNFEEETLNGTPVEVTYQLVKDTDEAQWDIQDYALV